MIESSTLEGVSVFTAFSRSEVSNWAVAIGVPIVELSGPLWTSFLLSGAGALVLLGVSIALAGYQSTRIARAVQGLIAPALALGRGDVPNIPRLAIQEAEDVAQALDRAFHILQSRTIERDQADAARRTSEIKLSVLVDHALDGLIAINERGTIQHFNPACEGIFGYKAAEAVGQERQDADARTLSRGA